MNSELDKLRKEKTREEFAETANCPETYGLKNSICEGVHCTDCIREASKDIQFKDDIEIQEVLSNGYKEELSTIKFDPVEKPKHYNSGKYEVIDIIESIVNSMELTPFEGYCIGNSLKYIARFKNKNGIEDIKKARWYLAKLVGEQDE